MASQSTAITSNEDSKYYVIDPDQYPISTLSITYRVQQFQFGPYIDFDGDNIAKLTVPNASQPQAHYVVASNVGKDDERYIESEWLLPGLCQRIACDLIQLCRMTLHWPQAPPFQDNGDLCIWLSKHQASPNPDGSVRYLYMAKALYMEENKIRTVRQDGWPTGLEALNALAGDISHKIYILGVDHLQPFTLAKGFLDRPISHTEADFDVAGEPIILPHPSDFT